MSAKNERIRTIILVVFIIVAMALCGVRLMKIQIVNGKEYLAKSKSASTGTQLIKAARGEIVDVNGEKLVKHIVRFGFKLQNSL